MDIKELNEGDRVVDEDGLMGTVSHVYKMNIFITYDEPHVEIQLFKSQALRMFKKIEG